MTYSAPAGFWEEQVRQTSLDEAPHDEDYVALPLDLLDGNGPRKLVHQAGGVDEEGLERHTLGAEFEAEHLDRVQSLKGGQVERVDGAKDEDHGEHGVTGGFVAEDGVTVVDVAGDQRVRKRAGRCRHADPDDRGAEKTGKHHLATADSLDELGAENGEAELLDGVGELDVGLADGAVDAGGVEDGAHEVGQNTITAPW